MTSRSFYAWAGCALALFTAQTSLLPRLSFHGVSTDFLLLLTVSFAFLQGSRYGVLMGFSVGLMQDLVTGTFFGTNVFCKMVIGYICGKMSDQVFKDQFYLPILASLIATVCNYFLMALFILLLGYQLALEEHVKATLLPMLCYQVIFAYPVHRLVCKIDAWLNDKKKNR
ncbi:MAG: rod shape-determining protein MreD [Selenomonadaceae bacterium]|nr:rod shape-determining protein MreD [Selenomonadaceae bacterium]